MKKKSLPLVTANELVNGITALFETTTAAIKALECARDAADSLADLYDKQNIALGEKGEEFEKEADAAYDLFVSTQRIVMRIDAVTVLFSTLTSTTELHNILREFERTLRNQKP
jgi:uncharacterized protein YqhQ